MIHCVAWYSILSRAIRAFSVNDETIGAVTRTTAEKTKAEKLKRESKGLASLLTRSYLIHLGITVVLSLVFAWLMVSVSTNGEVQTFDPFNILEIDTGADSKAIKKAYRRLSLQYHPDKNPGDRAAEAKFMMISKAYEALTDEQAKENWEKYGNPDGKQSLQFALGLPSFLLETKYRNLVLIGYLIIMVVVVPLSVWTYYSDSSKYGEKDVMYDTYAWFHHSLSEHVPKRNLPEALAGAAEFRKRNYPKTSEEREEVRKTTALIRSQMTQPKYGNPVCLKGNMLLHTHLLRKTSLLTEQWRDDLRYMLRRSTALIDAMISVCKHQDWLQAVISCIGFGQYMTQAMWVKDSPLLQIPHFTEENAKECVVITGKTEAPIATVQQYRDLPDDEKMGLSRFTATQKKDVMDYLKNIFPDVEVTSRVFVDDDEDSNIYENDLVTVEVTLLRRSLAEGQRAGLVHAPFFPFPKMEAWWVILGQLKGGKTISIEKVGSSARKVVHQIKFLAPPKGEYEFDLLILPNGYIGCDQTVKVKMAVLDSSVLPEYKVHPDDAALDDEPTLWEEMLNAHVEQDSDDEEEDEEGSEDEKPMVSAAEKKKEQLRKARQAADDDDDDDDDDSED
jgi:translocation protein SEC63